MIITLKRSGPVDPHKHIMPRAELHFDAPLTTDIEQTFDTANRYGLSAVAFLNFTRKKDFKAIAKQGESYPKVKGIVGVKVCYQRCPESKSYYYATLLAKNEWGREEIQTILATRKKKAGRWVVDLDAICRNRHNLLVGACGNQSELFDAFARNAVEDFKSYFSRFFDFYELSLTHDEREQEVYKQIYALGDELGVPVIAAGGYPLRPTTEMVDAFAYLGRNQSVAAVITNPQIIAANCE